MKDRNIELGTVSAGNLTGDVTAGSADISNCSTTDNIAPGVEIQLTSGGGTVTLPGGAKVVSVSGTTVTLDSVLGGTGSATGAAFSAGGASDFSADGGGLSIKGATDKNITWLASNGKFNFNEGIELANGKELTINGTSVISETTMMGKTVITDLSSADHTQFATAGAVKQYVDNPANAVNYFLAAF